MTRPARLVLHELLAPAECRDWRDRVFAARDHWTPRTNCEPARFFTLGAAAYLDATGVSSHDYEPRARRGNQILRTQFDELLERVRAALGSLLGDACHFEDHLALPGFHIFLGEGIPTSGDRHGHFDRQYWHLGLEPDPGSHPLSFTLPLSLPVSGSGLDVWAFSPVDFESALARGAGWDIQDYRHRWASRGVSYRAGELVLHDGLIFHRIAHTAAPTERDERVTLQGHGIRVAGRWLLYW